MTGRRPMAFVVCSVFLLATSGASAEVATICPPPPTTKLEAFEIQEGVTILQGRSFIGVVHGVSHGRIAVVAREMTNMSTGDRRSGVTIRVTESADREKERSAEVRESTSYIDYDELRALIRSLDQLGTLYRTSTRLDQFGGDYRTKGYFHLSVHGFGADAWLSVTSGLIEPVTASFQITDLRKLRYLLEDAVAKIDGTK